MLLSTYSIFLFQIVSIIFYDNLRGGEEGRLTPLLGLNVKRLSHIECLILNQIAPGQINAVDVHIYTRCRYEGVDDILTLNAQI